MSSPYCFTFLLTCVIILQNPKGEYKMNVNPMQIMQLKSDFEGFKNRHPKLEMFFNDVAHRMDVGNVFEISLTNENGNRIRTNIKITQEDKELIEKLTAMLNNAR
jgi:hypothetical protein